MTLRCEFTDLLPTMCDHCRTKPKPKRKPRLTPTSGPWEERALCRTPKADPAWWEAQSQSAEAAIARSWCARCPVTAQCLALAMRAEGRAAAGHRYGIYGGRTGAERRALYDQQRKATA